MAELMMRIVNMLGGPSPFDGKLLREYDPSRTGTSPDGEPMRAHLTVTDDPAEAMRFGSLREGFDLWRKTNGLTRGDGKPDRPLTAFNVSYEHAP